MERRTPLGKFIKNSWSNMNIRAGKYKHLQTEKKCRTYESILIEFTREEYKEFCLANEQLILSLSRPSLDRINKSDNYTINNIRFIELTENIRKDKTVFHDGKGICFVCKEEKDEQLFARDKRLSNGRTSICKTCDNNRKK